MMHTSSPRGVRYRIPQLERLESRDTPTSLSIGGRESLVHTDPDGNQFEIRIQGTQGTLRLTETPADRNGDNDSQLDPGEQIQAAIVYDASSDFRIQVTALERGSSSDGRIRLGSWLAGTQVLRGLFTDPGTTDLQFVLSSFQAGGFAAQGGIRVDHLTGNELGVGLAVNAIRDGAIVEVRHSISGQVHILGKLLGEIRVGRDWTGKLTIVDEVARSAKISVGGNMVATTLIGGNFAGRVGVTGGMRGRWRVLGHVVSGAVFEASQGLASLHVLRNYSGKIVTAGRATMHISGSVSSSGSLVGRQLLIYTKESFHGKAVADSSVFLHAADSVGRTTQLIGPNKLTVQLGGTLIRGARLRSKRPLRLIWLPMTGPSGVRIGQAPFVIRSPGYYRLAGHLTYSGSTEAAIEIQADNVVLDLQGYSVVGLAGPTSRAMGIRASGRSGVTILNGTVTGFFAGVKADSSYVTVERIRAIRNWFIGIDVQGTRARVLNNEVLDTGASLTSPGHNIPLGIRAFGNGMLTRNNIVSGFARSAYTKELVGLHVDQAPNSIVTGNVFLSNVPRRLTWGIWINNGAGSSQGITNVSIVDNLFMNFDIGVQFSYARGAFANNQSLRNELYLRERGGVRVSNNLVL